jgi:anti-sigma B factor antagonist
VERLVNIQDRADPTSVCPPDGIVPTRSGAVGITVDWLGRIAVVAVSGDVDMLTAPKLAEAITAAALQEPAALIVDLSGVRFLASAGMAVLISAHQALAPPSRFGVVADGPVTGRPLTLVGVDTIVAVYPTLAEAVNDSADVSESDVRRTD